MLSFFKKKQSDSEFVASTVLSVQPSCYASIKFNQFRKGIDNVHIDVYLSPRFTQLSSELIYELLNERSSTRRRATDKPSKPIREKLDAFNASYQSMLTEVVHHAKEGKRVELVQLFQFAVIKFVLITLKNKSDNLLYKLRIETLRGSKKNLDLSERLAWINQNKNNLLYQVTHELFDQIHWVESGPARQLCQLLLGVAWTLPEEILFNPLLQSPDTADHKVLMKHYVLLSQDPDNRYGFNRLSALIENLLKNIAYICKVQTLKKTKDAKDTIFDDGDISLSWKYVPANMDILFNLQNTLDALKEEQSPKQQAILRAKLQYQHLAKVILEQNMQQAQVIVHQLAAYQTPRLYEHYTKLLKPYLLYQALCDEISILEVEEKLTNQLKIRHLRHPADKYLSIKELKNTKKSLARQARQPGSQIWIRFITDFVTYQRDLKFRYLVHNAMEQLNLLINENDVQLSRSNGLSHEFLEMGEDTNPTKDIRCHVIIKADLRGSTTVTAELDRQGLNPATHFSRNFFNPISQLIENFGAEKVFIEGDAVILSLFEYKKSPKHWFAVARACGLAQNMLAVIQKQNQNSQTDNLPELELGIGICYCTSAPKFLYDAGQRIMISSAIGDADRLSSCSWKLRRKYAKQPNLLTDVMVFQQSPDDAFKGEKGMTTFRYNLNGIELHPDAFNKLQNETILNLFKIRLPGDNYSTCFYAGSYPDAYGNTHLVVVREGLVKVWKEDSDNYPLTDTVYYEVVTNQKILNTIIKKGLKFN